MRKFARTKRIGNRLGRHMAWRHFRRASIVSFLRCGSFADPSRASGSRCGACGCLRGGAALRVFRRGASLGLANTRLGGSTFESLRPHCVPRSSIVSVRRVQVKSPEDPSSGGSQQRRIPAAEDPQLRRIPSCGGSPAAEDPDGSWEARPRVVSRSRVATVSTAPSEPRRSRSGGRSGGVAIRMWSRPRGSQPNRAMPRGGRLEALRPHGGTHRLCLVTAMSANDRERVERVERVGEGS